MTGGFLLWSKAKGSHEGEKNFTLFSEKTNIDCFSSFSSAFMGVMFTRPSYRLFIEDATGFCRYVTYFLLCHKLIFKREKASARASSDRFCPCLSLSLISSHILNFCKYSCTNLKHNTNTSSPPTQTQRIPKEFPKNSQRIPKEFPKNS